MSLSECSHFAFRFRVQIERDGHIIELLLQNVANDFQPEIFKEFRIRTTTHFCSSSSQPPTPLGARKLAHQFRSSNRIIIMNEFGIR